MTPVFIDGLTHKEPAFFMRRWTPEEIEEREAARTAAESVLPQCICCQRPIKSQAEWFGPKQRRIKSPVPSDEFICAPCDTGTKGVGAGPGPRSNGTAKMTEFRRLRHLKCMIDSLTWEIKNGRRNYAF